MSSPRQGWSCVWKAWRQSSVGSFKTLPYRQTRTLHAQTQEYLQSNQPDFTESQRTVRESIAKICSKYPDEYWLEKDNSKEFPTDLHADFARDGWLGICIPEKYGGAALGISEAAVMMQTVSECGGGMTAASSIHMNIFGLEPVVKFGTEEQKQRWLTPLVGGTERACFGVTEPNTGLDTLKLQSMATPDGDGNYILNGSKIWTSTAQIAQKILILVRTTPLNKVDKPSRGLSLFYTDLDRSKVQVTRIPKLGRAAVDSNVLFFENWKVNAADRIGKEGDGFKMIMHGMNAERILVAAEALGLGYAALRRASKYATERVVFERPIGQNQGIQHPLADSWVQLESARLMVYLAARMYDQGFETGEYANAAKYLASEAAFTACERAVLAHGGMGYAKEYHVERYLREAMLPRLAPVSKEMILNYIGERVLQLPKSY
ncbi:isovaleryl-CoA dehydrogenase [Cladophialophora psammophila CBS 110553]|uniref:Isovaleryl-CoA dehydrogenase n=1 Tax=Cladophialophora psammophila CBS 110553 TaxID=1182543 RepID=W9XYN3_9EURO|nr:isovaleryl-CoA dehydrogenase [Cladophialophora psammophila CBS 110553]EXJ75369.1 isovaleryl-CoA dehydrogenase [Cladophialophora psammophila CBS 110553]